MNDTETPEREVEPWEGTGYPEKLIVDKKYWKTNKLFCGCKECRNLLRDAWQLTECGHRYCKACLDIIAERPVNDRVCIPCVLEKDQVEDMAMYKPEVHWPDPDQVPEAIKPQCPIDISTAFKDLIADKDVGQLKVKCPWECLDSKHQPTKMNLRYLLDHLKTCESRHIICTLCKEEMEHKDKQNHFDSQCPKRAVTCPHGCNTEKLLAKDLPAHKASCTKKPEVCRICSEDIKRSIHEHMKQCTAPCPYECENGRRFKITQHLEDPKYLWYHQTCIANEYLELKNGRGEEAMEQDGVQSQDVAERESSIALAQLLDVERLVERSEQQLEPVLKKLSEMRDKEPRIKQIFDAVESIEGRIHAIEQLEKSVSNAVAEVHMLSSYYDIFSEMKKKVLAQDKELSDQQKKLEVESVLREASLMENDIRLTQYIRGGFNRIYTWRVDHVNEMREIAKEGSRYSIFSEPFYTEKFGYKMNLRLYLNGDGNGKGTHISLFFVICKGEFDATLRWPFENKVTMRLLNQLGKDNITEKFKPNRAQHNSFSRPKDEKNVASGCPTFATQQIVFDENNGYVKDNVMFFQCEVDYLADTTFHD